MPYEGSEWYLQSYPSTNDVSQTRRSSLTIKQNMFWAKTVCGTKEVAAFHGEIRRTIIVPDLIRSSTQIAWEDNYRGIGCNQVFALIFEIRAPKRTVYARPYFPPPDTVTRRKIKDASAIRYVTAVYGLYRQSEHGMNEFRDI